MALSTKDYVLSVLGMPLSDEDKTVLILKLLNAAVAAQAPVISPADTVQKVAPSPAPAAPVIAPDLRPPAPAPAPVAPKQRYHAGPRGERIDDIVEAYTPGTVTLQQTGHTISLPMLDKGELAMGYLNRVHLQCGVPDGDPRLGAIATLAIQGFGAVAAQNHLDLRYPQSWAEVADRLYNAAAYMTESQREVARVNAEAFAAQGQNYGVPQVQPQPAPTEVPIEGVQG